MKVTEMELDNLFSRLKDLGVDKQTAINVSVRTSEKKKMERMMEFLNKGNPTVNEICAKSREIART